jgi:hypothetical protein
MFVKTFVKLCTQVVLSNFFEDLHTTSWNGPNIEAPIVLAKDYMDKEKGDELFLVGAMNVFPFDIV